MKTILHMMFGNILIVYDTSEFLISKEDKKTIIKEIYRQLKKGVLIKDKHTKIINIDTGKEI